MKIFIVEYGNNWDSRDEIRVYKTLKQAKDYLQENHYEIQWESGKPINNIYYGRKEERKWGHILIQEVIK